MSLRAADSNPSRNINMEFQKLNVIGSFLIESLPKTDSRGLLTRLFSSREFEYHGLPAAFTQESIVRSTLKGTLRGFHYQAAPGLEAKLVTCVSGEALDVVLDLRPESPTFGRWQVQVLKASDMRSVFVPALCAHAVQTLADDTWMLYRMSCDYDETLARGYRWDSPGLRIEWPILPPIISERDAQLPAFAQVAAGES